MIGGGGGVMVSYSVAQLMIRKYSHTLINSYNNVPVTGYIVHICKSGVYTYTIAY